MNNRILPAEEGQQQVLADQLAYESLRAEAKAALNEDFDDDQPIPVNSAARRMARFALEKVKEAEQCRESTLSQIRQVLEKLKPLFERTQEPGKTWSVLYCAKNDFGKALRDAYPELLALAGKEK